MDKNLRFRVVFDRLGVLGLAVIFILSVRVPLAQETYKIKRVIDGDTLELADGTTVQLIGIDAPENTDNQRAKLFAKNSGKEITEIIVLGKRSEKFLKDLLAGREVRIEFDLIRQDAKGNWLVYVFAVPLSSGKEGMAVDKDWEIVSGGEIFVNATMLKSGFASPLAVPPNVKYAKRFKELSVEALQHKRGLWQ